MVGDSGRVAGRGTIEDATRVAPLPTAVRLEIEETVSKCDGDISKALE